MSVADDYHLEAIRPRYREALILFLLVCVGPVPECCAAIRDRLFLDSAYSGWRWRHFRSSCRSGCLAGLGHAGRRSRGASHRRAIGSCTPFGFLRDCVHRERSRLPQPVGDHHRRSSQMDGSRMLYRLSGQLQETKDVAESRKLAQSTPGSADDEQARLSFHVSKAQSAK